MEVFEPDPLDVVDRDCIDLPSLPVLPLGRAPPPFEFDPDTPVESTIPPSPLQVGVRDAHMW